MKAGGRTHGGESGGDRTIDSDAQGKAAGSADNAGRPIDYVRRAGRIIRYTQPMRTVLTFIPVLAAAPAGGPEAARRLAWLYLLAIILLLGLLILGIALLNAARSRRRAADRPKRREEALREDPWVESGRRFESGPSRKPPEFPRTPPPGSWDDEPPPETTS